jgi:hypothetical protein
MADLLAAVEPGNTLTLIPSGLLGLMPLHVATAADQEQPAIDLVRLRYAPNARILSVRRPPLSAPDDSLLVVDALDGDVTAHLQLDGMPTVTGLHGPAAVAQQVMDNLRTHTAVHFACHGRLDPTDIRRSRLVLNEATDLTVASLTTIDRAPSLVVAAACESGLHAAHLPDETIGLPAAFLELGASGVIASQWAVPKAATAELMRHFYTEWRAANGIHPADALRSAQRRLRDEGRRHLSEWAGFVYIGA